MAESFNVQVLEVGQDGIQSLQFHLMDIDSGREYILSNCHRANNFNYPSIFDGNLMVSNQVYSASLCLKDDMKTGMLNIRNL